MKKISEKYRREFRALLSDLDLREIYKLWDDIMRELKRRGLHYTITSAAARKR